MDRTDRVSQVVCCLVGGAHNAGCDRCVLIGREREMRGDCWLVGGCEVESGGEERLSL